jgi:hypothetical protein
MAAGVLLQLTITSLEASMETGLVLILAVENFGSHWSRKLIWSSMVDTISLEATRLVIYTF